MKKHVLVTGGTGFIGSHTCISLIESGYNPIILDNLWNSNISILKKIDDITSHLPTFFRGDIRDEKVLEKIFSTYPIDAIIHFAALKSVEESTHNPVLYFDNNISGLINVLKVSQRYSVKKFIFSSSATVYGAPKFVPVTEESPLTALNPYAQTKLIGERILQEAFTADNSMKIICLRYFNPAGAHISGKIGENPTGIPKNLIPYISQVAIGRLPSVKIFGTNYPTHDGTGVRDYIHIMDLANGHLAALDYLKENTKNGEFLSVNLGTGTGYSVLETIKTYEKICKRVIKYEIMDNRPGDVGECYSDPSLAHKLFGWKAQFGLAKMCEDSWRWQQNIT